MSQPSRIARCHIDLTNGFGEIEWTHFKTPVIFKAKTRPDGMMDFALKILKGNALVGIVPIDEDLSKISYSDTQPPHHGYFVKVTASHESGWSLFGQDGTFKKTVDLSGNSKRFLSVRYDASARTMLATATTPPRPTDMNSTFDEFEQALEATALHLQALEFSAPLANKEYAPCVILGKNSNAIIGGLEHPKSRKRRRTAESPNGLTRMWQDKRFADAVMVCEGRSFEVHRSVVALSSPVLAAAFSSGMVEDRAREIIVKDASAEALHEFLCYVYTGDFDNKMSSKVLPLAVRYQVNALAMQCGEILVDNLSHESAAEVLPILREHRADENIAPLWDRVVQKVQQDKKLVEWLLD